MILITLCIYILYITDVTSVPLVGHLFIIMFENQAYDDVINDMYWSKLATYGLTLTNMYALTHPSQPNYIAQLGGSMFIDEYGNYRDNNIDIDALNVVDLLEQKDITWRAYQEDYVPLENGMCNPANNINNRYYRKHLPHMSFIDINTNIQRCQNIVNSAQLDIDLQNHLLPQLSYYTPNILNDCHDTGYEYCGQWLSAWLNEYWELLPDDTLIILAYDEDNGKHQNKIANILLGPYIVPNTTSDEYFTQYSLTRLFEQLYDVPSLNRDEINVNSYYDLLHPITSDSVKRNRQLISQLQNIPYPVPTFWQLHKHMQIVLYIVLAVLLIIAVLATLIYCGVKRYRISKDADRKQLMDSRNELSDDLDTVF